MKNLLEAIRRDLMVPPEKLKTIGLGELGPGEDSNPQNPGDGVTTPDDPKTANLGKPPVAKIPVEDDEEEAARKHARVDEDKLAKHFTPKGTDNYDHEHKNGEFTLRNNKKEIVGKYRRELVRGRDKLPLGSPKKIPTITSAYAVHGIHASGIKHLGHAGDRGEAVAMIKKFHDARRREQKKKAAKSA